MLTIQKLEIFTFEKMLPKEYCLELQQRKTIFNHTDEEGHGAVEQKDQYLPFAANYMLKYDMEILQSLGLSAKPISIDPMMKIYKLEAGAGVVPLHVDNDYTNDIGLEAKYSLLVYLNDEYTGGETNFVGYEASHNFKKPGIGDGVLFKHDIPHEGLIVKTGTKYVLKTDLFVT